MMAELRAIFRGGARRGRKEIQAEPPREALAAEFPAVELRWTLEGEGIPSLPPLSIPVWESNFFNFYELDGRLDDAGGAVGGPFAVDSSRRGEERLHGLRARSSPAASA